MSAGLAAGLEGKMAAEREPPPLGEARPADFEELEEGEDLFTSTVSTLEVRARPSTAGPERRGRAGARGALPSPPLPARPPVPRSWPGPPALTGPAPGCGPAACLCSGSGDSSALPSRRASGLGPAGARWSPSGLLLPKETRNSFSKYRCARSPLSFVLPPSRTAGEISISTFPLHTTPVSLVLLPPPP